MKSYVDILNIHERTGRAKPIKVERADGSVIEVDVATVVEGAALKARLEHEKIERADVRITWTNCNTCREPLSPSSTKRLRAKRRNGSEPWRTHGLCAECYLASKRNLRQTCKRVGGPQCKARPAATPIPPPRRSGMPRCLVDGCPKYAYSRGVCQGHYQRRAYRSGTP